MAEQFHLLGICGTAMASLAGLLKEKGHVVTGSDQGVYPPMSTMLDAMGVRFFDGYRIENLTPRPDVVVVGNAIPRGNPELEEALNLRLPYASMPEIIKRVFIADRKPIVVSGTHGKTTTTSMIAWLLTHARRDPGFLIGGVARNFRQSYHVGQPPHFVIEGDEYDTAYFDKRAKFHHYLPECLVINYVEYDHVDIYPTLDSMLLEFRRVVNTVPSAGLIVADAESPHTLAVCARAFCPVETFALSGSADWTAADVENAAGGCTFSTVHEGRTHKDFRINLSGSFNVKNALAAAAAAHWAGLSLDEIRQGLAAFEGVLRRLELRGTPAGVEVYDDFAHHPTAIRATLDAARGARPGGRLFALFEPRSWSSRRNLHQQQLPWAFEPADVVLIARVFQVEKVPADVRLDPEALIRELHRMGKDARYMPETESMVEKVVSEARRGDRVVVMSNGAFDGIHERLLAGLAARESAGA